LETSTIAMPLPRLNKFSQVT